jgi:hypothetical protein
MVNAFAGSNFQALHSPQYSTPQEGRILDQGPLLPGSNSLQLLQLWFLGTVYQGYQRQGYQRPTDS